MAQHRGFPLSVRLLMTPYEQLKPNLRQLQINKGNAVLKTCKQLPLKNKVKQKFPFLSVLLNLCGKKNRNHLSNSMSSNSGNPNVCLYENVCENLPKYVRESKKYTNEIQEVDIKINEDNFTCCKSEIEEAKKSIYKNPEYYCYHPLSYYNFHVELSTLRSPQLSKEENNKKKIGKFEACDNV